MKIGKKKNIKLKNKDKFIQENIESSNEEVFNKFVGIFKNENSNLETNYKFNERLKID